MLTIYIIYYFQESCCHPHHKTGRSSKMKQVTRFLKTTRHINKTMSDSILQQTGVVVPIGSGNCFFLLYDFKQMFFFKLDGR